MFGNLLEQLAHASRWLKWKRPSFRWTLAPVTAVALAASAYGQDSEFVPPQALATNIPEPASLPLPGDVDYIDVPKTDLEARVRSLEEVIRRQALRQRELEEQVSLTNANANLDQAPAGPKPYVIGSDTAMSGKWTANGAELQSKNGDFKTKLAGRVQADTAFVQSPDPNTLITPGGAGTKDAVYFRRLRLGGYGTMWETIDWATEFDIANTEFNVDPAAGGNNPPTGLRSSTLFPAGGNVMSVVAPTDVWMTFRELPTVGNIRIGNQKEMIGLEHMNSSRFLDFMERSPLQDAFNGPNNNGFTPGITAYNAVLDDRATWGLGVFKNNDYDSGFPFDIGDTNYAYNGRVTWTPMYDEPSEGRFLLHTGLGTVLRTFDTQPAAYTGGTNVRLRARGDVRNMASTLPPNFVDTGNFYVTDQLLLNPELALVYGPWLFQAEYEWCNMGNAAAIKGGPALGTVNFQGGYAQVLYFLTGEHRAYNRKNGSFGRVVPYENAIWTRDTGFCGIGAWQVGMRYDWLDLNSGGVNGGNVNSITLGLNWFLNPNTKIQFNYVAANPNGAPIVAGPNNSLAGSRFVGDGTVNSIGTRLAWDF